MVATPLLKSYWTHIPLRSFQKAVTVERQSGVIGGRWDRGMKIYIGVFLQSMPIVMLWVTGEEDKRTGKCTSGTSCRTVDVELLTFLGQLSASVCSLFKKHDGIFLRTYCAIFYILDAKSKWLKGFLSIICINLLDLIEYYLFCLFRGGEGGKGSIWPPNNCVVVLLQPLCGPDPLPSDFNESLMLVCIQWRFGV